MARAPETCAEITPHQKQNERPVLKRHWRAEFMAALAETSNVSEAARVAGIDPCHAYKVRRVDAAFRAAWSTALLEGYEHLEMETLHRLRRGTQKEDGNFDIANALRVLTLHRETIARERALRDNEDEDSVLASLTAKIAEMRQRDAEMKQLLLGEAGSQGEDCEGD